MKVTILPFETAKTKVCFLFYCTGHSFLCGATWARLVVRSACVHSELSCARFFFPELHEGFALYQKKKKEGVKSGQIFICLSLNRASSVTAKSEFFRVCTRQSSWESFGRNGKEKVKRKKKTEVRTTFRSQTGSRGSDCKRRLFFCIT